MPRLAGQPWAREGQHLGHQLGNFGPRASRTTAFTKRIQEASVAHVLVLSIGRAAHGALPQAPVCLHANYHFCGKRFVVGAAGSFRFLCPDCGSQEAGREDMAAQFAPNHGDMGQNWGRKSRNWDTSNGYDDMGGCIGWSVGSRKVWVQMMLGTCVAKVSAFWPMHAHNHCPNWQRKSRVYSHVSCRLNILFWEDY